ncbi:MAG: PrsW family intramembrane metalloprotease [Treponema sp.]
MSIIRLIAVAFIPAFICCGMMVYRKQPLGTVLPVFLAAAAAVLAAFVLQAGMHRVLQPPAFKETGVPALVFHSFIVSAFIEEGVKAGVFVFLCNACPRLNRRETALNSLFITAVLFGLIFSGFENIFYAIRYPHIHLIRLCSASVLHGGISVFYRAVVQANTVEKQIRYVIEAIFLHGAYNFFTALGGWFFLCAAAVLCKVCFYPPLPGNKHELSKQ